MMNLFPYGPVSHSLIFFVSGESSATIIFPFLSHTIIFAGEDTGNFSKTLIASSVVLHFSKINRIKKTALKPGRIRSKCGRTKVIAAINPCSFIPSSPFTNEDVLSKKRSVPFGVYKIRLQPLCKNGARSLFLP